MSRASPARLRGIFGAHCLADSASNCVFAQGTQLCGECRAKSPQQVRVAVEGPLLSTCTQAVEHTRVGVHQIPALCSLLRQQLEEMSGVSYAGEET